MARDSNDPAIAGAIMLKKGSAKKVTIYVNEDSRYHLQPLYEAILTYLMHKGVAGATASRAMAGFGPHRVMHTTKIEVLTEHLPIRIEFVESEEKVNEVLPTLHDMVTDGLIEVHDTTIVKSAMQGQPAEARRSHQKQQGKAKLLRIYMGESDKWNGEPLYDAIVKQLRMMDISGATVYRGLMGYGVSGETRKEGFLGMSHDLPVMVSVVESAEKIDVVMDTIEGMMQAGLIVVSDVEFIRFVHSPLPEAPDAN
jgi:PII-like signaling protein